MMDTTNQGEVAANPLYSESETEEDNSLRDEMEAELQDDTMPETRPKGLGCVKLSKDFKLLKIFYNY